MKIINDPNTIRIRSGIQAERDQITLEIAVYSLDLFENMHKRKASNVKMVTVGDVNLLIDLVRKLAETHFYLKYGNRWISADEQRKEMLYRRVAQHIIRIIVKSKTPLTDELAVSVVGILEDKYNRIFGQPTPTDGTR